MENMEFRQPGGRKLFTRAILGVLAIVMLVPVIVTFLYSFCSPQEIEAFMKTRGNYDTSVWMEVKLSPKIFRKHRPELLEQALRLYQGRALYDGPLGEEELAPYRKAAGNWRNLFDPRHGLMNGRRQDGTFQGADNHLFAAQLEKGLSRKAGRPHACRHDTRYRCHGPVNGGLAANNLGNGEVVVFHRRSICKSLF